MDQKCCCCYDKAAFGPKVDLYIEITTLKKYILTWQNLFLTCFVEVKKMKGNCKSQTEKTVQIRLRKCMI